MVRGVYFRFYGNYFFQNLIKLTEFFNKKFHLKIFLPKILSLFLFFILFYSIGAMINDEEISVCFLNSNNGGDKKEKKEEYKAKDEDIKGDSNENEGVKADDTSVVKEEGEGEIIKENEEK